MSVERVTRRPKSGLYFLTNGGGELRRILKPLPCPTCDGREIWIDRDIDEEPYSFKAHAECNQCGTKGPRITRVVGPCGCFRPVEREAAHLWNEVSKECMAGERHFPKWTEKAFEKIWRRISRV